MSQKKWYVKVQEGQTFGPLTTEEVVAQINAGLFVGDETLSKLNEGEWYPITHNSYFFDKLINQIQHESLPEEKEEKVDDAPDDVGVIVAEEPAWKYISDNLDDYIKQNQEKEERKKAFALEKSKKDEALRRLKEEKERKAAHEAALIKKEKEQTAMKKRLVIAVAVALLVVLSIDIFYEKKQVEKNYITLRAVNFKNHSGNKVNKKKYLATAIQHFRRHTTQDYLIAQESLAQVLESDSKFIDGMGFMCMTYKELWPYSRKNSEDINTIYNLFRHASTLKPESDSAGVCYVVYQWVVARYGKVENFMRDSLRRSSDLLLINQLMGDFLEQKKSYQAAIYYFEKVRELWPNSPWLKPVLQEARTYRKLKKYDVSLNRYRLAMKYYPNHPHVLLEIGVLEYQAFKKRDKSKRLILQALKAQHIFEAELEAEAYFTLAQIARESGDKLNALKYANKSFSLDSGSTNVKKFIVNLGGRSALEKVNLNSSNMLYLGTQYMKVENYFAAQAEFRAAFETDPKNALAAYYAGQALWKLNQSDEARKWVEKAIKSDPNLVSAYVTLSEYYSYHYDYESATAVLREIRSRYPKNNDVYRGFASVEYAKKNFLAAIKFSKKALDIYPLDTEALQILVKSYLDMEDFVSASKYVEKTMELDPHTPEIHTLYALTVAGLYGGESAIDYLNRKISASPNVVIYKKTLAEVYANESNWSATRIVLESLLVNNKDDKKILLFLGDTYKAEGFFNQALEVYLRAASLDPQDATPLFKAGQLYLKSNQPKLAIKQFERVLKVNKKFPKVYYHLGQAALSSNDIDRAITMVEIEKKMNPNLADPYILAAEAYTLKRQFSQCASEYQKAILRRPQGANIYIKIADCYRLDGALDSAASMLEQAALIDSGNPEIFKILGAIWHVQGLYSEAHTAYEQYLRLAPNAIDREDILQKMQQLR